ncbi:MAG: ABC transporter ATP-binding protein [Desulfomonilaceae bacterium]
MPILEGLSVSRRFGGLTAVCDVDFHLNEEEILGLIGPNGAGKSTLFNLISAALTPKPGKILFKGVDITGIKPNRICRMGLARTFQNVKIFSNLSVLENVLIGSFFGSSAKVSPSQARHYAEEALAFTGLSPAKDSLAADLTLANQKRLEVARALATKPQVIMLDEIMEGLNPSEVSQAMDLVIRIRDSGVAVIMIEHVMKAIMHICDRVMVLHHGVKIADGTPAEIATDQNVMKVYLGDHARVVG